MAAPACGPAATFHDDNRVAGSAVPARADTADMIEHVPRIGGELLAAPGDEMIGPDEQIACSEQVTYVGSVQPHCAQGNAAALGCFPPGIQRRRRPKVYEGEAAYKDRPGLSQR